MANKYDLVTKLYKDIAGDTAFWHTNVGADVPAGKTRFLTFLRVERVGGLATTSPIVSGIEVAVASFSTTIATINSYTTLVADAKTLLRITSLTTTDTHLGAEITNKDVLRAERRGSIEHPICSVAGSNYMAVGMATGASATIMLEYYDE